jgi:hypothetical protein
MNEQVDGQMDRLGQALIVHMLGCAMISVWPFLLKQTMKRGKLSQKEISHFKLQKNMKEDNKLFGEMANHRNGNSSEWQLIKMATHQNGNSSKWQLIKMAIH